MGEKLLVNFAKATEICFILCKLRLPSEISFFFSAVARTFFRNPITFSIFFHMNKCQKKYLTFLFKCKILIKYLVKALGKLYIRFL